MLQRQLIGAVTLRRTLVTINDDDYMRQQVAASYQQLPLQHDSVNVDVSSDINPDIVNPYSPAIYHQLVLEQRYTHS